MNLSRIRLISPRRVAADRGSRRSRPCLSARSAHAGAAVPRRALARSVLLALCTVVPARAVEIPVTIEELLPTGTAGQARSGTPLRFGVPLPESAAVDSSTPVSMPGLALPQVRPLAKYPSGRWRWMLVETLTDLGAGEKRNATLVVGGGGFATGAPLGTLTGDSIVVRTGPATFHIRRARWNGIDAAVVNGTSRIAGGHGLGLVAADSGGTLYTSALDAQGSVGFESNGPLACTVVARGWLRNASGTALFAYTARQRFALGRSDVELELTVQNAETARPRPAYFRWVSFQLPLAFEPAASVPLAFGLDGATRTARLDSAGADFVLYQGRTTFREDHGTNGDIRPYLTSDAGVLAAASGDTLCTPGVLANHLDGWLAVGGADADGIAAAALAVRDLAPLYPTGLRLGAAANGARVLAWDLLSPANTRRAPILWAWGAHHTGTAWLGFDTSARQSWMQVQFPVLARPSFEWVRQTGAIFGETRLVDYATQAAWFAQQGKNYTLDEPRFADLAVRRYYSFGSTGGPNQYDQSLTFILDWLRAGSTPKMLRALQDASWKADQAVFHSDDFDFGSLAYGETDPNVSDPDCWNGHGAGVNFDNEHPHWLTLPILYYITGDERLREAAFEYCEWRRYRAGNHSYGPIYGKGMSSLRLWSRAWRDIALAWELTRQQRYYDDLVRMTQAIVTSVETPGKNGRNYERGYIYTGDWSSPGRPIRLFFTIEILGTDSREPYRLLPDGPLREDLRDFITGLSYFTVESRLGSQNNGFTYTYYVDGTSTPGTRGDQVGLLAAHGYEWTGDPVFADLARDLAWRPIVYADWERGSEPAALVRCWTDLHRDDGGVGWMRDLQVSGERGSYTLTWTAPAGAAEYIVKYAEKPLVPNLWYDAVARRYRHDPAQYAPFWAGRNVQGEPAPAPPGTPQSFTVSGLDPNKSWHFAVCYRATAPVAAPVQDVTGLASRYDEFGRVVLEWGMPAAATESRVVRNDTLYAGFAAFPSEGTQLAGTSTSAVDSSLVAGPGMRRGRTFRYTVFARDAAGRWSDGARLAVTYDPPPLRPVVTASASSTRGEAPFEVRFEGSAFDPDGDLASQVWSFGDGTDPVDGAVATHTYAAAGTYEAAFTATDSTGLSRATRASITVLPPEPPQLQLAASAVSGRAPVTVGFEAQVTDASPLVETLWTFDAADTLRATSGQHTFTSGGRHVARFRAADVHGLAAQDSVVLQLLPPDVEAPRLVGQSPAAGATIVPRQPEIVVALADTATGIDAATAQLLVNEATVDAAASASARGDSLQLAWTPATPSGYGETVRVRVRARDRAAQPNLRDSTWTFVTDPDAEPPRIVARTPEAGSSGAPRSPEIAVTLVDSMTGLDLGALVLEIKGQKVPATIDGDAARATLRWTPAAPYRYGETIAVRVHAVDRATSPNALDASWSFGVEPDVDPPRIVARTPDGGESGVPVGTLVEIQLGDAKAGIDPASVQLDINGLAVRPSVQGTPALLSVSGAPASRFAYGSAVTVRVRAADLAGAPNRLDATWTFGTEIEPVLVNFQPAAFLVPAGYRADSGKPYSAAQRSGWLTKVTVETKGSVADPRLRTYAYVASPAAAVWQLALPAGSYSVNFAVGSPTGTDGLNRVVIEGQAALDRVTTKGNQYQTVSDYAARVEDGFLTVSIGGITGSTKKTRLCYIEVRSAPQAAARPAPNANAAPSVSAVAQPDSGLAPLAVQFAATAQDPDGDAVSLAWAFGDGATAAGSTAAHTYTAAGTYAAIVTASDSAGHSACDTVLVRVRAPGATQPPPAAAVARVDFQPSGSPTPAGYTPDVGAVYDATRGFGWLAKTSTDTNPHPDTLLSTYAYVTNPAAATWQLKLPAGTYAVTLVAGSPQFTGQHRVELEGAVVVNDVATGSGEFCTVSDRAVQVTDGFLTVRIGGIAASTKKTKLCYIAVRPLAVTLAGALGQGAGGDSPRAGDAPQARPEADAAGAESAWRLNFQPRDFDTPAGWTPDSGEPFDVERGIGWDRAVETNFARTNFGPVRNSWVEVDNRSTATFSLIVPRGTYRVSLVTGSPKGSAENRVSVEGRVVVRDVPTRVGGFIEVRDVVVDVVDGALTVTLGGTGRRGRTKMCSLEVQRVDATEAKPGETGVGLQVFMSRRGPALEISSPVPVPLRVNIYDVRGRLVRCLWQAPMPGTRLRLEWDRRDERGGGVAAGVYLVRAEIGRQASTRKLLLLR